MNATISTTSRDRLKILIERLADFLQAFVEGTASCAQRTAFGIFVVTRGENVDNVRLRAKIRFDLHGHAAFLSMVGTVLLVDGVGDDKANDLVATAHLREGNQVFLLRSLFADESAIEPIFFVERLQVVADDDFRAAQRFNRALDDSVKIVGLEFRAADNHDADAVEISRRTLRADRARQRKNNRRRNEKNFPQANRLLKFCVKSFRQSALRSAKNISPTKFFIKNFFS